MDLPLISINNATVRFLNNTLFTGLSFSVDRGKSWALIGKSGSGKSALLHTIAGRFNITGGEINFHFFDEFLWDNPNTDGHLTYHKLIALVEPKHHFKNLSNTSDFTTSNVIIRPTQKMRLRLNNIYIQLNLHSKKTFTGPLKKQQSF